MKRLLLIKTSSLGDVVHALPAVSDANAAGYSVDWVVEEAFTDIPAAHAGVDRVIPIAWRRWRKALRASGSEIAAFRRALDERTYDVVLDAQGLIKSAAVCLLSAQTRARTVGLNFTSAREPWAAFAYGRRVNVPWGPHAIDRNRALFAGALGYDVPLTLSSGLDVPAEADRQTLLLLHGTTWETKHWPVEMWAELARLATAAGYAVKAPWGDETERARAESLVPAGVDVLPRMDLATLMGELARASLVVSVDSGLGHLSAALGVPTVGLYGPTSGELTGCRGSAAISLQSDAPCSPCLGKRCRRYRGEPLQFQGRAVQPPCFGSLTPDRVWQRALDLVGEAA